MAYQLKATAINLSFGEEIIIKLRFS